MKVNEIKKEICEGISISFQKHNFTYRKTQSEFIRKTDRADQIFHLTFYKENDGTITIKPELIIHIHDIESIYKSIAQIKYRPYLTLGNYFSHIRDYDGDAINYKRKPTKYLLIEDSKDVKHLIKIIPEYLEEDILPYFDNNSSIVRVDELLNKYPDKMSFHNYLYPLRANIAIIAAKLNNNPHYNELVKIYERELKDAEENYKIEFCRLKELLSEEKYQMHN